MSSKRILVTGATGQQGGAVVEALLDKGHQIFALTRNSDSARAIKLTARGVDVVRGDLDHTEAIRDTLENIDSLFLVGSPFEAGVDAETKQGINVINAAITAGVSHVVYSSVADADKSTAIPHFDSKFKVEQHLVASGVAYTIIAPAFFYDNMMAPFVLPGLKEGALAQALPANIKLQSVSVKNIGECAVLALDNQARFNGKRINLAGDELTGTEYADVLSAASKRQINYVEAPIAEVRKFSEDMALMYEWFAAVGYSVDVGQLKLEYPEVEWETFSQWAGRQDWSVLN
jgi:uncharacterized protein YbjT (DUF2867 family)